MPRVLFQPSDSAWTTVSVLETALAHQLNVTSGKPLPPG